MKLNEHILLWKNASIRLLDIRRAILKENEELRSYCMPASFFLFSTRGGARVELDGTPYHITRFYVMHGGKGANLDISPKKEGFEYYLIFYKADLPLPCRQDLVDLLKVNQPFTLQYGMVPHTPLSLLSKMDEMYRKWCIAGELELFHVKTLFYQYVYEILWQLHRDGLPMVKADPVTQAVRFMQDHYANPITLDSLSETLDCSVGHIVKLFKREIGSSPIQYLTSIRIEQAKALLLGSEATLEEIAVHVGYPDKYYFGRIFKKHTGISPIRYRIRNVTYDHDANCPSVWRRMFIGGSKQRLYIIDEDDNHYQYTEGVELHMLSGTRMLTAIILCLTLLLSACSSASPSSGMLSGGSQSQKQDASVTNASQANKTRTVSTIKGDITVPDKPQRVVVDLYLGSFIALNVKPVGTPTKNLKNPYYAGDLNGVEDIGEYESISLEKIVSLQPDMIVTGNETAYESFRKIAPTILVPFGNLKTTHEEVSFFGKVLGKETEAESWLAEYDKRISAARAKVDKVVPKEATFSIMQDWDKTVGVFGDNFGRGGQAVYQALGRKPPAKHAAEIMKQQSVEVSREVLQEFSGDYIIFTSDKHSLEDLKSDSIWGTLDAVKNNRVYIWKGEKSWYFDPIATLSQTEELAAWLAKESPQ